MKERVTAVAVNSLFQHQDDVVIGLVCGVQVDHSGVVAGHLQDGHLVSDVGPTVTTSPPLPQELCCEHFPSGLLHAALDHSKLPPITIKA